MDDNRRIINGIYYVDDGTGNYATPEALGICLNESSISPISLKEFNCPDCEREDTCEGCPRTLRRDKDTKIEFIPVDFPDSFSWRDNKFPPVCEKCSNNPKNGGSGTCSCCLPLLDPNSPYRITCSTVDSNTYIID